MRRWVVPLTLGLLFQSSSFFLLERFIHSFPFSLSLRILPPPPSVRVLPAQTASPAINTTSLRSQPVIRQLPPLPTRQLPNINQSSVSSLYFDLPNDDDEILKENLPRTSELFYYQTSSSSASNNSLTTADSDNEHNDQQDEDDDEDDDHNGTNHQRLQSDDDEN